MHPLFDKADKIAGQVIGGAIEVHRDKGPGLVESIYERCFVHELHLRGFATESQRVVRVEYKGMVFDEPLRFDVLVGGFSSRANASRKSSRSTKPSSSAI